MTQLPIMARNRTALSMVALGKCWTVATTYMPIAAASPTSAPFSKPSSTSFMASTFSLPDFNSPKVIPRRVIANAWPPMLPD